MIKHLAASIRVFSYAGSHGNVEKVTWATFFSSLFNIQKKKWKATDEMVISF
jgi:hypothetical protein